MSQVSNPLASLTDPEGSYVARTLGAASTYVSHAYNDADLLIAGLNVELEALEDVFDANTVAPNYAPVLTGITLARPTGNLPTPARGDYAALQPTPVTLPARGPLLSDAQSDAIFARARSRIGRASAGATRKALYQAAEFGLGMPTARQTALLRETGQKALEAAAQVALEQAAQEGAWAREDTLKVLDAELKSFTDRWSVVQGRIQAEEATMQSALEHLKAQLESNKDALGWTDLQVKTEMERARIDAQVRIDWGNNTLTRLMSAKEIIIKVKAALAQALLSLADAGFSASANQGFSASQSDSLDVANP